MAKHHQIKWGTNKKLMVEFLLVVNLLMMLTKKLSWGTAQAQDYTEWENQPKSKSIDICVMSGMGEGSDRSTEVVA